MVADLCAYLFVFRCGIAARWSMRCTLVDVLRGGRAAARAVEVLCGRSMRCVGGRDAARGRDAVSVCLMHRVKHLCYCAC